MGSLKNKSPSLSALLKNGRFPRIENDHSYEKRIQGLQLRILRIQQGVWHQKKRAIIAFEGFDASGKGGAIRRLTEDLDPRGIAVHPIGPPLPEEQGRHWLYRFWKRLPAPGTIAIFDRTWYGRVLVERIEKLAPEKDWKRAYREIREFEQMLTEDGVELVKVFIGISKDEQLKRFEERLNDPYKQWKLTPSDVEARARWGHYVEAVDDLFRETDRNCARWNLIPGDDKHFARCEVLESVSQALKAHGKWMESKAVKSQRLSLAEAIVSLGKSGKG